MKNFPPDHELIAFFESEPTVSEDEPSIPWVYKQLQFKFVRSSDVVHCEIDNPVFCVTFLRDGNAVFDVHLEDAFELRLSDEDLGTVLIARSNTTTVELQLRPFVRLAMRSDSR